MKPFLRRHRYLLLLLLLVALMGALSLAVGRGPEPPKQVPLAEIMATIKSPTESEDIKVVKLDDAHRSVTLDFEDKDKRAETSSYPTDYGTTILEAAEKTDTKVEVTNNFTQPQSIASMILSFLPLIFIGLMIFWLVSSTMGGRNGARAISEVPTTRFTDLAGVEEAVEDMSEITDFLRNTDRFREIGAVAPKGALMSGPPGVGKAIHKDTPIPMAAGGFKLVGDVVVGDRILDDLGKPTSVIGKYQPKEDDSYLIRFSGGVEVRASGSHLWPVMQTAGRKEFRSGSLSGEDVVTTREIYERFGFTSATDPLGKGRRLGKFSVRIGERATYPARPLPYDAYLLGLWLGDGYSHESRVTGMLSDLSFYAEAVRSDQKLRIVEIKPAAYNNYKMPFGYLSISANENRVNPFRRWLKNAGLYKNKHIPNDYLYSSEEDRLRLLAGLLDTDGTVNKQNGTVSFATSNEAFADQVVQLVSSLGFKASKYISTYTRKDTGKTHTGFQVSFYPTRQVFLLPRKQVVLEQFIPRFRANVNHRVRYIESIERIEDNPEDYYCFTVDSPSHLFLCTDTFLVTHNTMLARAVAGEAGVPFFHTTGSDFVELFVGLGARRVRQLFKAAKKHDRCIVFIDEIDSIGGRRGKASDGPDSREHNRTINALLSEMDGFEKSNVIVLAATNNPEDLDPALTRAGRFDRKIVVDLPDWKGRMGILKIHSEGKPLGEDVDFEVLAKTTVGLSGADLANLVNEALINAVRAGRTEAHHEDFMEAISVVTLGRARHSAVMTDEDKQVVAWHEAGHAVVGLAVPELPDPSHVTIVPRGMSGGHTKLQESEHKFQTSSALRGRLAMMMGGMAAEKLMLGDVTQGPGSDLRAATDLANTMVSKMGMGSHLTVVEDQSIMVNSTVSEAVRVEAEVLITTALTRAEEILADPSWRSVFDAMSTRLLEVDTLETEEIQRLKGLSGA